MISCSWCNMCAGAVRVAQLILSSTHSCTVAAAQFHCTAPFALHHNHNRRCWCFFRCCKSRPVINHLLRCKNAKLNVKAILLDKTHLFQYQFWLSIPEMKQIVTIVSYSLRNKKSHMEVSKSITTSMKMVPIYSLINTYGLTYLEWVPSKGKLDWCLMSTAICTVPFKSGDKRVAAPFEIGNLSLTFG